MDFRVVISRVYEGKTKTAAHQVFNGINTGNRYDSPRRSCIAYNKQFDGGQEI